MLSFFGLFKNSTGPSGFGENSTAREVVANLDLTGKHILITGCNSGLGSETMQALVNRGATVFGAARNHRKARQSCESLETPIGEAIPVACELSEPDSVRACARKIEAYLEDHDEELDAIICNAGIMALPELRQKYGYELQFFINHIGHFLLVTDLLDSLAEDGRAVMVSSRAHLRAPDEGIQFDNLSGKEGYDDWKAYGQSKLANLLLARELGRRFEADESADRTAIAIHPGVIATNIARNLNVVIRTAFNALAPLVFKSIPQGAATQTYAAVHPDASDYNGEYLVDCAPTTSSENGRDMEMAKKLWERSEEIVDEVAG